MKLLIVFATLKHKKTIENKSERVSATRFVTRKKGKTKKNERKHRAHFLSPRFTNLYDL